jgi:inositol 1,4,5-triphosphate receptor type 1
VEVIKKAYMQGEVEFEDGENGEDGAASPRNVGHNIYILAHQVWLCCAPPDTTM